MSFLITGLGNTGEEYEHTRHNIGRDIVEAFRLQYNFPDWRFCTKGNMLFSVNTIQDKEVILVLPETFMNNSGHAVLHAKKHFDIHTENIIIVHDDIDMALGQIRIAHNRGTGGHNGLESIIKKTQTKAFARLRFGIVPYIKGHFKKPRGENSVTDFVLKKFKSYETDTVNEKTGKAVLAIHDLVINGREHAMNNFNEKPIKEENENN